MQKQVNKNISKVLAGMFENRINLPTGVRLNIIAASKNPQHKPPRRTDKTGTPTYHQNTSQRKPPMRPPAKLPNTKTVMYT